MMVGSLVGSLAEGFKIKLPVLMVFIGCMVLSNELLSQDTADVEASAAQVPVSATGSQPGGEQTSVDVTSRHEEVLKSNNKCLRCHKREKTKLMENGEEMSLQVHGESYINSAHGQILCTSCHESIGNRKHPSSSTNITVNNQRDYSLELNESCRQCHRTKYTEYKGSIHAALIAQGNTKAPLCSDCHNAHAVESMADYQAETGQPCSRCHVNIFNAYASSVHGQARMNGNTIRDSHIQSPICSDCHKSHQVTALAIGDVLRTTCINCHENVTLLHSQWLPNSGTHLDIVSCAVCHAPFAKRRYDLHLFDNQTQEPVEGNELLQEQLQAIVDEGVPGDPMEIWKSRGGIEREVTDISLRSRMEVMSGIAAHQIANKSFAVRTCDSCHEPNSRQSQNVTVSFTQADGRRQSVEADREILSTIMPVNSISDFYALGGNPNKFLDYLLLLALFAGVAIPIAHFSMGRFIRDKKAKGEE